MPTDSDEAIAAPNARRRAWRWLLVAGIVAALLTLVIAIVVGARSFAWSDLPAFVERMTAWRDSPLAMLSMIGCFIVGGLVVFPVNLLIATSIVVFGPVVGGAIAWAGSLASAGVLHQIGAAFPEHVFSRFAGRHAEQLRERVARHGLIAVAIVRLLPLAPYSIVSLAAGIAGIGRVPYFIGTALGMLPGVVLYALFADRARKVIADPRPLSWAMLLFALLLIVAVALLLRHLRERAREREARA
ncbi:MAG TPA: VTT domain-containing protein [Rhodanobacteraceae bacterium]